MSSSEWKKESFGEWAKVIPGYSFKSGDFGDVVMESSGIARNYGRAA